MEVQNIDFKIGVWDEDEYGILNYYTDVVLTIPNIDSNSDIKKFLIEYKAKNSDMNLDELLTNVCKEKGWTWRYDSDRAWSWDFNSNSSMDDYNYD